MLFGKNPGLKRKPWRVWSQREKILILRYYASPRFCFLPDHIAKHAAFLVDIILLSPFQLLDHIDGKNRQRDQLRVRMLERRPGGLPVILKNQNVLESAVFLKVE